MATRERTRVREGSRMAMNRLCLCPCVFQARKLTAPHKKSHRILEADKDLHNAAKAKYACVTAYGSFCGM